MVGEEGTIATILVADYGREDLLGLGSPLVNALRALGYAVLEAQDHYDVLCKARAAHPDAVLL
jgi:DNA-binding response OmpR family regulator